MVEKISVQIALTGTEEIKRQLAGVSAAGQKCFEDISSAAAKAGGFDKLDPTLVAKKFNEFGITATADVKKITAALQAAGKLEGTVAGVQKLEQGIQGVSKAAGAATAAFGLTRREVGALSRALRAIDLGPLGSQLALVGRVGGAFGPIGIAVTALAVALTGGLAALVKFAADASETAKQVDNLAGVSGRSFERVSSLVTAFSLAGANAKDFSKEMGDLAVKIELARRQSSAEFWGPVTEAQKKHANQVGVAADQFARLARGGKLAFSDLTTTETKQKGLLAFLAEAQKRGEDVELVLADIVKNMTPLERAEILPGIVSPQSIEALKLGRAEIERLRAEITSLGLNLTGANQQALLQMARDWNQFIGLLGAFFQKMGALAAPAFARILESFKPVMAGIISDFENLPLGQAIANLGNRLAPAFTAIGNLLSPIMVQMGNAIGVAFVDAINQAILNGLSSIWANIGNEIETNLLIFLENIRRLMQKTGIEQITGATSPIPIPGGGNAAGGLLGGRGTGTSDSNLAWVSRGEHIMPARAVAQPGVLALLEALRRSGGNLAGVLNGMGRFALGGMVPRHAMAFAGGGMVGGANLGTLTLGLPSGGSVSVRASTGVVDQLRQEAALAQVRSGGRKPSRYS